MSAGPDHVTAPLRWVSLCTVLSRVLGLVRDAVMAATFGNGPLLDAFTVAFRIPNLTRALLGEGALATAFLPAYVAERERHGRDAARRLAIAVVMTLSALLLFLIGCAELVLIVSGWCWTWPPGADLMRRLLIWLMPYPGFICLAAQLGALLNAERQFVVPALVPAVLNLVWLAGLAIAAWETTDAERQLFWMAAAVLVGGVAQVALPLAVLGSQGFRFDPQWRTAWSGVRRIGGHMLPVVGGLMVMQLNVLIDSFFAWGFAPPANGDPADYPLTSGTASALYFGQRLYQFPLGVFGVALGTVLFPLLAEHAQLRQWERLRADFSLGLRYVAAIGFPASVGLMLLAQPLAALLFEYGEFDAADSRETANMIAAYGSGVWAYCGLLIVQRGFYALGDRMTPIRLGMGAVLLNVVLNLSLIWILGGIALAVSTSLVSMLQCLAAGALFHRKIGGWSNTPIAPAVVSATVAAVLMGGAGYGTLQLLADIPNWYGRCLRVAVPLAVSIATYLAASKVLNFQDPFDVLFRRRPPSLNSQPSTLNTSSD